MFRHPINPMYLLGRRRKTQLVRSRRNGCLGIRRKEGIPLSSQSLGGRGIAFGLC